MSRPPDLTPARGATCGNICAFLRDEEHVTVIVTTHLMEEAERCDRLAILNEGKLVALGTPSELKQEIGGDVIWLEATRDAQNWRGRITSRAAAPKRCVIGENQDAAHPRGNRKMAIASLPNWEKRFPEKFSPISVSKPTLEDVFIRRTGHRSGQKRLTRR